MAKYRKRPVVIEAKRWHGMGDHAGVEDPIIGDGQGFVRCVSCGFIMTEHGMIRTLEGRSYVCPGDWVITGIKGEQYPIKDSIFRETYDEVL